MLLKGKNTVVYGNIQFYPNIIIEDHVVIGHPSVSELKDCLLPSHEYKSVEELYSDKSKNITTIGSNSIIRSGTVIYSGVTIGNNFDCGHNVLIRENVVIGDSVYVKSYTEIMKNVKIGNHCRLAGIIADNSTIADNVSSFGILTHKYERHFTPAMSQLPGPTVHKGCIIGRGAMLIGGIHVYENSVIGVNTVVNFDVPPNSLVVGSKGQIRVKTKAE
jgi:acetyltransferase-like isoleucine patch superfamily enzyme